MEYQIHFHDAHPVIHTEEDRILIDTGSPNSYHEKSTIRFMGRDFRSSGGGSAPDLHHLSKLVGTKISCLLGMDIMKEFSTELRFSENKVSFSEGTLNMSGRTLEYFDGMGVPVIHVDMLDQSRRMYLDTGARLSYIHDELTAHLPVTGYDRDFYPGYGRFETDLFLLKGSLLDRTFQLKCGHLPIGLKKLLLWGHTEGILGYDFFKEFNVGIDVRQKVICIS